ncbi:sulfatase-like hydrolase/transferase [Cyclobacterium marinum]|uniref:sulfatase-like hydrolase/transferase n=1 Tax=Cyclobacterium marinum TaxID=104 RepID=UPI0011ECB2BD|nr:sulfatase-like hydrolase/transferase [Cyclobacterium marinum]MBI0401461.1 sulfatase-like hydrolase/transferase [Cyclobacterium marinum]|tara:strand:- start:50567 stop:51904 length:1338 start_codon:yes stop_codon:yes gene_type:complete
MKNPYFFLLMSAWLLSCGGEKESLSMRPNIVLIMADDLGYGDLSCYGNEYINTPNLDLLASEGVLFTDYHSNGSVCSPTRAALMTGKYQQRTGVEGVVTAKSHRDVGLALTEVTLAEELKQLGYYTGMFGKWHLGYDKAFNPTLQGFDEFVGFVSGNVDYHGHIDQEGYLDWWDGVKIKNEKGYTTDLISEYGVKFIQEHNPEVKGAPFFLYLPHEAPHSPYQRRIDKVLREIGTAGTQEVIQDSISSIYKEMVEVMDEGVGRIMQSLKETGQYENTIVIFISDNGANHYGDNGGLRGFKAGPYEGGSRVPAIFSFPKEVKGGSVNNQTVLSMDLLPTLLDFIGRKPSSAVDGISIKENLLGQEKLPERDVFFAYGIKSFIRSGDWKLVVVENKEEKKIELFNLSEDLEERNDLKLKEPDISARLLKKLEIWTLEVREGVDLVSR